MNSREEARPAGPEDAPGTAPEAGPSRGPVDPTRREFLKAAGAGAAVLASGCLPDTPHRPGAWPGPDTPTPSARDASLHVAVVGAGAFGAWSALFLRQMGARVTLVDKYGPGNSRATSGGETRGVRSSYGDRPHGPLWAAWATDAIRRWLRWDEEWGRWLLPRVFFQTGDLIFRPEWDNYLERSRRAWDDLDVPYEVLDPDEVHRRYPGVHDLEGIEAVLHEPQAGVVRARRAIEGVAEVFRRKGGRVRVAEARVGRTEGQRLRDLALADGERLEADRFVFALGPWFPGFFPELMGRRLRTSMGHVVYLATPPGDHRFSYPNLPSYGFPGVTGWPALPPDHRGFRVRTGGRPPGDPDETSRWLEPEHLQIPLDFVDQRFPALADAPVSETRACHYESSVSRNFIIDRHPDWENAWLAGGGSAEGFKFGPRTGEYVAERVLGLNDDPELARHFRLREEEFQEEEVEGAAEETAEGTAAAGP